MKAAAARGRLINALRLHDDEREAYRLLLLALSMDDKTKPRGGPVTVAGERLALARTIRAVICGEEVPDSEVDVMSLRDRLRYLTERSTTSID